MAMTPHELQYKLDRMRDSENMKGYLNTRARLNFEPFSVRKTNTTIQDCFAKLLNSYQSVHNKKYKVDMFPYYVFFNSILDLEGNVVFYIQSYYDSVIGRNIKHIHITSSFYNKYTEELNKVLEQFRVIGFCEGMMVFNKHTIYPDAKDLYYVFNKKYTFDSIVELRTFKKELVSFAQDIIRKY
jgi:hypothetical protein